MNEIIALSKELPQIVMFFGDYCGPCRMLKPVIESFRNDEYGVHFIDVTKQTALARMYNIQSIPTVFVFDKGKPVGGFKGYIPKLHIEKFLNELKEASVEN